MYIQIIKNILVLSSIIFLSGCGFFDKDNTPPPAQLVKFMPEIKPRLLWSTNTGKNSGEYLKMSPQLDATSLYTTNMYGILTSVNKLTGCINWRVKTNLQLITGPGIGDGIVVVGSRKGHVVAFSAIRGTKLWQQRIEGEILANPAILHDVVVIKTIDGQVYGLSSNDGHFIWHYEQLEPNLMLRGSSQPLVYDNGVINGFANGTLVKLNLQTGQSNWQQAVATPQGAFPIQRMIDIDADPILYEHHIYAATYQGKIASLDWLSGRILWDHDISSYTGMIADNNAVYISDARSFVWNFNADSGLVNWRQTALQARTVSGPAIMGNYIVVGDKEGYLHWLSKDDGHFAARVKVNGPVYATPIAQNNVLYVLTNKGSLLAYVLG